MEYKDIKNERIIGDPISILGRKKHLIGSSACIMIMAMTVTGGISVAQETNPEEAENVGTLDEIVVTGNRLALRRAIDSKRNSKSIKDAIGLDDLGKMPDKNIGESINRMPGISMLVEKGEGRFVQIRGISPNLNNVTINGMGMGSPESDSGGRRVPLDVIGGELLGGVEVIKARTPDMDGQGIGGTLNLITKQPFDMKEDFWALGTIRAGKEQYSSDDDFGGHMPFGGDMSVGGINENGSFGWLVGGSYAAREYAAQGIFLDDWRDVSDGTTTIGLPEEVKNNYYVIGRERMNLNVSLEFRPNETSKYFVRGFYAAFDEFQHRNRFQQEADDIISISGNEGVIDNNRASANVRLEKAKKTMLTLAIGGENEFGDLMIDYQLQKNRNELDEPFDLWEFRSGSSTFGPDGFSIGDNGVVTITPNINGDAGIPDRQDAANLDFRRVQYQERIMNEDVLQAMFNLSWDNQENLSFKTGAKYSETKRDNDYSRDIYTGAIDFTLAEGNMSNGGFTNVVGGDEAPNIWMDLDAMNSFFAANPGHFSLDQGSAFSNQFASDYFFKESVLAAYGMGTYENETLEVIAGLRLEKTNVDTRGFLRREGVATDVDANSSYTDWLPSLIATYRPNDEVVIRSAITRAIGRPDFDDAVPRSAYIEETGEAILSIGNPELEARRSWNYDLSLEYYFNDSSLLSVAVFYKDISNEITSTSQRITDISLMNSALADVGLDGDIDTSGLTELVILKPINSTSSVLKGLEIGLTTQFDFLPSPFDGFGLSSSVTFIDGHTVLDDGSKIPLIDQTKRSTSVTLFYQYEKFDASLTFGHNASFLTNRDIDDPSVNLNQGSYGRFDFKASYEVTDGIKVFVDWLNINNEPTTEFQGGNPLWNTEHEFVGTSYFIGVSASF